MENILFNFTTEMKKQIVERQNEVKALMALSLYTNIDKPVEILNKHLLRNLQESSTWEEIKEKALNFAEQILDRYPENYDETKGFIDKITSLEGELLVNYLQEECGYFLFPSLKIAFSLDKEVIEAYNLKQIA